MEELEKSEIRKHYFMDRYTIFSPRRNLRPKKLSEEQKQKKEMPSDNCFFCPQNIDNETPVIYKIGDEKNWDMALVENKFPALTLDNPKAFGKQEVLIETPEHNKEFSELPIEHIEKIFKTYSRRVDELRAIEGIKYVLVFKNDGGKAGASVPHAHSQIIALPMIPPKISRESDALDDYWLKHRSCPYCEIIKKEMDSPRVAYLDENIIAICPYASTSPYGVWILPRRHVRSLNELHEEELKSLVKATKVLTHKLDLSDFSYNYYLSDSLELENHHFKMKIIPRINIWAGLELSTGIIINPIFPEEAVEFYRAT